MFNYYPAKKNGLSGCSDSCCLPIVLVHGWGCGAAIWSKVLPLLRQSRDVYVLNLEGYAGFPEDINIAANDVCQDLPKSYVVLAYSLGGVVASLSSCFLKGAQGLVTVGTNIKFVADEHWPWAMAKDEFLAFQHALDDDNAKVDSILRRFSALQCKNSPTMRDELRYIKTMQNCAPQPSVKTLQAGLQRLAEADLKAVWCALAIPSLHQFGYYDQLVPVQAAQRIQQTLGLDVQVFNQSAHQPFLSETALWLDAVNTFADHCASHCTPDCA